jgi:hypothetical protein
MLDNFPLAGNTVHNDWGGSKFKEYMCMLFLKQSFQSEGDWGKLFCFETCVGGTGVALHRCHLP